MKAFVTGANGLIGSNLVRSLLSRGHEVKAFVRRRSDRRSLEGLEAEIGVGDVLDTNSMIREAEGCDVFFHTAALFSYSKYTKEEMESTAVAGTLNAVEAAKEAGIKRLVLTSSSVIFGSSDAPYPLDESRKGSVQDTNPPPYITAKILQDEHGFNRARELELDIVAVCPTVCVGPHDYGLSESNAVIVNYLNDPFKATWPGGCNLVSVEDVADGHVLIAEHGESGQRYLLGSQNLEWATVHRLISELCGIKGPLLTANHTTIYLTAVAQEILRFFTDRRPLVSREQAKMVGRHYWYLHDRAGLLGYHPMPARTALAKAISWLVKSQHICASVRSSLRLSREVYDQRRL